MDKMVPKRNRQDQLASEFLYLFRDRAYFSLKKLLKFSLLQRINTSDTFSKRRAAKMATKESLFMVFSLFAMFLGATSLPSEKGK